MSDCCSKNSKEPINVCFGYSSSPEWIEKSLWWITRDYNNSRLNCIILDDGKCNNIESAFLTYISMTNYKILKFNEENLKSIAGITSFSESKNLAYAICNKLTSGIKVNISPKSICYNYFFKDMIEKINENQVLHVKNYMIPKYVHGAITTHSSNFCEYLAKECRKYPIYNESYPAKNVEYVTKAFYNDDKNKEIIFLDYECFNFEEENNIEYDKHEFLDESIVDKLIQTL